jgi:hypothetical protein
MMMMRLMIMIASMVSPVVVLAKDVTLDFGSGPRYLQTTTDSTPECGFDDDKLICSQTTVFEFNGTFTEISFTAVCKADSNFPFDYRRARNCGCLATITNDEHTKQCPCTVCAAGFGDNPVNIDCSSATAAPIDDSSGGGSGNSTATPIDDSSSSAGGGNSTAGSAVLSDELDRFRYLQDEGNITVDPFVIGKCVSLDCSNACNGTCGISCEYSDNQCPYCTAEFQDPTRAPEEDGETTDEVPENFSSGFSVISTMAIGWTTSLLWLFLPML